MLNIMQLVRVRSKDGNFRFDLPPNTDISVLLAKVSDICLLLLFLSPPFPLDTGNRD